MKTCCICGKEFIGYGNNPYPIRSVGECCDSCNIEVIKERMRLAKLTIDAPTLNEICKWIEHNANKYICVSNLSVRLNTSKLIEDLRKAIEE